MAPPSRWRRRIVSGVSLATVGAGTWGLARVWPEQGFRNDCRADLPAALARHPVIEEAWEGIDPAAVWDAHAHLVGVGDSSSGVRVNPALQSPTNPKLYAQYLFYLNAGCVHDAPGRVDASYVARLQNLVHGLRPGCKVMLYAFDEAIDAAGRPLGESTMFHVPDAYAAAVVARAPQDFEWVASIHPYREDALDRLREAVAHGARAVKWLPSAMLIDPASPRCDAFYAALAAADVPLITHAGAEAAVHSPDGQHYGNPLRLRRALEHGVRVVVAHCASHGRDIDLDAGPDGPERTSFELFARLMDEPRHAERLHADVSAIAQRNRESAVIATILDRTDWHPRLLNGSDYPLPGILPLYSIDGLIAAGLLDPRVGPVVKEIREHNPILFDFVLKRHLRHDGHRFASGVFETRGFFTRGGRDRRDPAK